VSADAKRFNQSKLIKAKSFGRVEIFCGNDGRFAHTAIDMDTKYFEIEATIRFASAAGGTCTTMKIGFERAAHAWS